jgi:hypothetical protein
LCHGYIDPSDGSIAGGRLLIDVGARDEPIVQQSQRAIQIILGKLGIGPRNLHGSFQLRDLLRLHRPLDGCENLIRANPVAGLDMDSDDTTTFPDNAHRHIHTRGEGAGGVGRARDHFLLGNGDGDERDLADLLALIGHAENEAIGQHTGDRDQHKGANDQQQAATLLPALEFSLFIRGGQAVFHVRFIVHEFRRLGAP